MLRNEARLRGSLLSHPSLEVNALGQERVVLRLRKENEEGSESNVRGRVWVI